MTASQFTIPAAFALLLFGCGSDAGAPVAGAAPPTSAPAAAEGCGTTGAAFLRARLRGGLDADLDWHGTAMQCEAGPRPDGAGLRVALAGSLDGAGGRHLRLVFGIGAPAPDGARATNVTVIQEGEGRIYSTQGDDRCTTERLIRTPASGPGRERIEAHGFCTGPATALGGDARLVVQTFDFTVDVAAGDNGTP